MEEHMNRWRKWPFVVMVSFVAEWTTPARGGVLLYTQADTAALAGVKSCSQQLNSFGTLVTSNCGPIVNSGPGFVTTLTSSSQSYSANGGVMGVAALASGTSDMSINFGSVDADAFAEVFDNVHPLSKLVATGAMMGMQINFMLEGVFSANVAGPVSTTLHSELFYKVNGRTLDIANFTMIPGIQTYSLDAGMVPNGGVLNDFEGYLQTSVEFDGANSILPVDATVSMVYVNTAKITSVTATYNGQPVPDFTLTGDSGALFPTGPGSAPEPESLILVGAGLAACWMRSRTRRLGRMT
jgi:hypothetical protein